MGSSMVIMCSSRSLLILSSIAASVVDLPEPVGPVTSTNPRGFSHSPFATTGKPSASKPLISHAQKHRFEENPELDFSFGFKNLARFRGHVFYQTRGGGARFRTIPWGIKGFCGLGLPWVAK